jgi:hypothetical protein
MSQQLTVPVGAVSLAFFLSAPDCDSPDDHLELRLDGAQVWSIDGSSSLCGDATYVEQVVPDAAYADGEQHLIEFTGESFAINGAPTSFFIDAVSLTCL